MFNVKRTLEKYRRVLALTKKPEREEVFKTARICLIGIGLIGLIGFLVYLIFTLLPLFG